MVNFKLLRFETYGIKNIKNKITIDFANKTLTKKPIMGSKVKAIYGGNGFGKSAIINAVSIYKSLCMNSTYLLLDENIDYLDKIINSSIKEFYFKTVFSISSDDNTELYSHEILVKYENNIFVIARESFNQVGGQSLNDLTYKNIYFVENGTLIKMSDKNTYSFFKSETLNSLNRKTFIATLFDNNTFAKVFDFKCADELHLNRHTLTQMMFLIAFLMKIKVCLESEEEKEKSKIYLSSLFKSDIKDKPNLSDLREDYILRTSKRDQVNADKYKEYESKVNQLADFIKIFKPNLLGIEIDKKIYGDYYYCNKIFVYDDCKVDIEYESTGIKKIVNLFSYIDATINGEIVFIDEMDANIGEPFMSKLIEFLLTNSSGQLCFTSHNLEPMEILKSHKKSIEFINNNQEIISWVNNSNYKPAKQYVDGMIEGLPFNIDSFDFYSVFDYKED